MENILKAFNESIAGSYKIKKILLDNLVLHKKETIQMNLVYLDYNFDDQTVKIDYYVKDSSYPSIEFNFKEFEEFVNSSNDKYIINKN